jgi:predicted TIM-barrel fold metal-dependent hydrolase
VFAKSQGDAGKVEEYARLINDELAEICAKDKDHFPGWVAQGCLGAADAGVAEATRAIKNGALGVQIYTNVAGKPLDDAAYEPFFATMEKLDKPIWLHPARNASVADYASETKSKYEIWWTFGWSYETGAAMARLVFSRLMDKYPNLKIITHHFGGIVPMLEGRIGPGWDQLGARTSDEDLTVLLKQLKKRPLDYFKHSFYADTATFSSEAGMTMGLSFFDHDKIVFASDCPFDPEKGTMYTRDALRFLEAANISKAEKEAIAHGNLERITGTKLVK